MTLDRKIQPKFKDIDSIQLPLINKTILDNKVEIYGIKAGTQDILKIDIIFDTSSYFATNRLVASTVNKMLIEGTHSFTSQQIVEKLDYYGAFLQLNPTKDAGNITLFTLKKYLSETIRILYDVTANPIFSENELSIFLNNKRQKFLVEIEKVTEIARREFNEQLFGKNHPYGKKTSIEDYDGVKQNELKRFHKDYYKPANCKIIVSGNVEDQDIEIFNKYFGNKAWKTSPRVEANFDDLFQAKKESYIERKGATQSAIRLGKITIKKSHPDYHKLDIANTILGGYFGSRLMKVIREEKGYTYGINSVLVTLQNAGFVVILAEVGTNVTLNAINDILKEVKTLREELVTAEELNLVKNYMLGALIRSFDGPLEISSSYKSIIELRLNTDFYQQKFETIKSINPKTIRKIANEYLHEDSLIKTVAGKYD